MSRPKGSILTEKHKGKIRDALKENKNGCFAKGKHIITDVIRKNMSNAHKGQTPWNKGLKGIMVAWNKGKTGWMSEEGKDNIKRAIKSGFEARNWIDGRSFLPYTQEFNQQLKESIRKQNSYTCQLCGVKEKDYFQKLSIHHLDYNKNNCNEDNLITVCRSCNAKLNSKFYRKRATTIIGYLKR